jgi:hypothetical protein
MRDVTNAAASQDAVELVFTLVGITAIPAFSQAVELSPVVPAPRLLADVSADGPLVPELTARRFQSPFCKGRITFQDNFIIGHFREGGERSDSQSAVFRLTYPPQVFELADADELLGGKDIVAKTAEEVRPPGMEPGAIGGEMLDRIGESLGLDIGEIRHKHRSSLLPG